MNNIKDNFDDVITAWLKLTNTLNEIDASTKAQLMSNYPFEKDYMDILFDLMEWRESLD